MMNDFVFTNAWFEAQRPVHSKILKSIDFVTKPFHILEIGSHEGRSTVFFTDYLVHPESTLTCIDPYDIEDTTTPVDSQTFKSFQHNIKLTNKVSQISLEKDYSLPVMMKLFLSGKKYQYILIDGSHLTKDVLTDAIMGFNLLDQHGIIFFDDYQGGDPSTIKWPAIGIESFIKCFSDQIEVIHIGYHLVVRKIS